MAQTTELHRERDQDEVGLHKLRDVTGATSCAYVGGEGIHHAPHGSTAALKGAEGSAAGMTVGLAGATIEDPGESGSGQATAGAARLSLQDTNLVSAGVASTSSTGAGGPESSTSVVLPGAVTTSKPAAGSAEGKVAAPVVSTLQSEGYTSERDGSQKVSHPRDEAWKEKKERRTRLHRGKVPVAAGQVKVTTGQEGTRPRKHPPTGPRAATKTPKVTKEGRTARRRGKSQPATSSGTPSEILSFFRRFSHS